MRNIQRNPHAIQLCHTGVTANQGGAFWGRGLGVPRRKRAAPGLARSPRVPDGPGRTEEQPRRIDRRSAGGANGPGEADGQRHPSGFPARDQGPGRGPGRRSAGGPHRQPGAVRAVLRRDRDPRGVAGARPGEPEGRRLPGRDRHARRADRPGRRRAGDPGRHVRRRPHRPRGGAHPGTPGPAPRRLRRRVPPLQGALFSEAVLPQALLPRSSFPEALFPEALA